ncbi:helix-turn-helix domain-containing protein [Roseixanthobacter glucoisosaccharinicivorans]|uniref:helix-turn-helix domain-containing protein n=1 Tax=Roseixanthobacter glucoisosaccharinicivorans TaxID=3119923 RepID=UPI003729D7FB
MTTRISLPPEHPGERQDGFLVATMAKDYPENALVARHSHRRSQLVFASSGVMRITTDSGAWVVPPQRAVWLPPGIEHEIQASGILKMRTLYFEPGTEFEQAFPTGCTVIEVSPLVREVILRAVEVGSQEDGKSSRLVRLMAVLLDEIKTLTVLSLHLPIPADRRVARICEALLADPSADLTLGGWSKIVGASERTLARQFLSGTGMSFAQWRQKARLLAGLVKIARGEPILSVALDMGYSSPSAFSAMFRRILGAAPSAYFSKQRSI